MVRGMTAFHTVTFDCWSTLIYEAPRPGAQEDRLQRLAALLGTALAPTREAFAAAWRVHQTAWHRRVAIGWPELLGHMQKPLGLTLTPADQLQIQAGLEQFLLQRDVQVIAGARELLQALREAGVHTALVCDTGFSDGRVVRQLLARLGLLPFLEALVFSDELGVTKPHPHAFASALGALGTHAQGALHVGDMRRTDVAGAHAAGMIAARFRGHHDDRPDRPTRPGMLDCAALGCEPACPAPEAELIMDSHAALAAQLGLTLR